MVAELVPINKELLDEEETSFKFDLLKAFTNNHMVNLLSEDQVKRQAVFYTQSYRMDNNYSVSKLIDTVDLVKIYTDSEGKLC